MRLSVLVVVFANADPARRELGKRKQGAKALAAMTEECRAVLRDNDMGWLLEPFNEIAVSRVPADRRLVLDINRPESMDARALARYLGRPVPAFHAIPISALNFCSYDGVLRGPFGFRLSADELKHSSVRSIDHK